MRVPDDQDYTALAALLKDPAHWTPAQAETARLVCKAQIGALAGVDSRNRQLAADMAAVLEELTAAIAVWEAGR